MNQKTDFNADEKFGKERRRRNESERRKRESRQASLGAYVIKTLGSDTTPENFFSKAKTWVEKQKKLQRSRKRAEEMKEREFYPTSPKRNPLSKYEFDTGK